MTDVGKPERATQQRIVALFREELGYRYLGDWTDREGNSNVEEKPLNAYLSRRGYNPAQIGRAIHALRSEAGNHARSLYANNKAVYELLRYGVPVKLAAGKATETVHLVDWQDPGVNDFAVAEEVTLKGGLERRPDLVLYVNGIAVGVLELKNSRVSIGDGIRQSLSNQQPEFNAWFFGTVQFVYNTYTELLVVVDKLLTGFDAPPCTYLYIDKSMQDHGLFQAICRVNRLDGDDKEFGYIVDYKDLFRKVENAIAVYASELDQSAGGADPEVLLQDRLAKGKERLDQALEAIALLCEPVEPPKGELEHIRYFCGNTEIPEDLKAREPQRAALYKATVALLRGYAAIADELEAAGYGSADVARIKRQVQHYLDVREIVRKASGESLDLKAYEADMRHLIDTYIEADDPRKISPFDNIGLLDLIVKTGIANAIAAQLGKMKGNRDAVAETIENNVRSRIIKEHLNDPAFYAKMSALLDEIIRFRKEQADAYEEYLKRIAELVKQVAAGHGEEIPEQLKRSPALRALYNNLKAGGRKPELADRAAEGVGDEASPNDPDIRLAMAIDETVKRVRPDGWRGVQARELLIKRALYDLLHDEAEVERIFLIVKAQSEY